MRMISKIFIFLVPVLFGTYAVNGQISYGGIPYSFTKTKLKSPKSVEFPALNKNLIKKQDEKAESAGGLIRIGVKQELSITTKSHGEWIKVENGFLWRLTLRSEDALSIGVLYKKFALDKGSELFIYSKDKNRFIGSFDHRTNPKREEFSTERIKGDAITIELFSHSKKDDQFIIEGITHFYKKPQSVKQLTKGFGSSQSCEVNINCAEGDQWQDQKRGVARIILVIGNGSFYCSGSLINNVLQDQKAYFLSAYHCGEGASTADYNQWMFYFNFESANCTNPGSEPASNTITGCTMRSNSNDPNISGSDFLLLEFNSSIPSNYNVYYNGWDRSGTASPSGVSIHHPAGDIQKISTYNTTLTTDTWNQSTAFAHWEVTWSSTNNGHGVTEGGSSGSPIFNNNKLIVGDLSGGLSFCNTPTQSDLYGKFSYSWASNGNTPQTRLSDWLDPNNSGVMSLQGLDPNTATNCNITSITAGTKSSCNPATNTYSQDITINFTDPPASGMLEVNGQQFAFSGTSQTVTLANLTADGNTVNVTASFTADSGCSNTANALFSAPANCVTCSISNITVGTRSSCNTSNNTYTQELSVTYANSIGSGTLTVNGQQFPINSTSGTETITLTNLMSDGNAVNISASISTSPTCTYSANAAFTAPSACLVCQTFTSANTPINLADNSITTDTINIPHGGSITDINVVNLNGTHTWINDLSFILTGPDGTSINLRDRDCGSDDDFNLSLDDVANTAIPCPPTGGGTHQPVGSLASFNGKNPLGDWTITIEDHAADDVGTLNGWGLEVCGIQLPCALSNLSAGSTTDCSAAGDNYTKEIVVTYANPPSTGTLDVNGQNFTITSSPQTVQLANLSSDGMPVNVTAAFSTDAGCNRTENALFTAPTFCILCNHNQNDITGSVSDSTFISQLSLESDATVTSGSVLYRSPISIELENDFQVTGGALFEAQIGDCIND